MKDWQGEKREGTPHNIRAFWADKARGFRDAHGGMMRDHYYRLAEIAVLAQAVRGARVLDVGCGAGWATMFYASQIGVESMVGCDITEGLIARANRMLQDSNFRHEKYWAGLTPFGAPPFLCNVTFEVQDVLDLPYPDGVFDTVMFQRLLINLPTRELQQQALSEMARVLAPGGRMIISEVTEDGHERVNALRAKSGLAPLERYWHNCYLHHNLFVVELQKHGIRGESGCLSLYGFLSKVFYPAMIAPNEPRFMSGFNRAAMMVSMTLRNSCPVDLPVFMDEVFRGALAFQWRSDGWTKMYDAALSRMDITAASAAITSGCNHQTLYVMEKLS